MKSSEHKLFQQPWPEGGYRLFQMGFVVDDILVTAARWANVYGVGPFHVLPPVEVSCTYRGSPSAINLQIAVAQAGPVQIELMTQHCDRPSIYRDFQSRTGSTFHQLCTVTSDYDGKKASYGRLGYEIACEIVGRGARVCFFDTVDDFGFFTEVVEEDPVFLAQLAHFAQISAEWDGADPVRMLTRDGYRTPNDADRDTARRHG